MKLSDLKTGETGIVVHVHGHGGFRKRIVEMGFIKGETIKVLLNAPLRDPVKYKVMDYEVSLRRAEAELVEVVSEKEAEKFEFGNHYHPGIPADENCYDRLQLMAHMKEHELNVVFVGNPNCGKTTIFNAACGAHERVGNYSGVTVDAKVGEFDFEGYHFNLTDLPGTYSLTAYSPEELYVRRHIIERTPDIIVNVVDASNLERNLYLTTQLIDMDVPMIMALNMYDELRSSGNTLDTLQLGTLLGVPVVPTVGRTGEGVLELFRQIIAIEEGRQDIARHIHVNHGSVIEQNIEKVEVLIRQNPEPHHNYSGRFLAIKMLENDRQIEGIIRTLANKDDIIRTTEECKRSIQNELGEDSESAITDAKYGFVQGALKECFRKNHVNNRILTKRIDAIATSNIWGYPIFLLLMYVMFYCTFNIGQYPMDWIDMLVEWISGVTANYMSDGPLKDLIIDGIIGGVGGVVIFLPNIMILYAFISYMEDSGYMARAAFIMDKMMHKMGLHGKSFIPMIMGFGCNIPAVMATRTIEDRKSRLITMLIIPLMSCSARLPVYIIIIGAFFPHCQALVLFAMYLIGVMMSILMAKLFSRFVVKGESSPFVMELPPYRLPSAKNVVRHTWEKGKQYLKKMGTTILAASIIVWALSYFPHHDEYSTSEQIENSYIGQIGKTVEPVIRPCGMGWKEGVSIITGIGAKEIVASTMGVLYSSDSNDEVLEDEDAEQARLSRLIKKNSGLTTLSAFAFIIFVLLYMPCIPTCISIKNEAGSWHWAAFTIFYTTLLAWICSTIVFQIGSLL
ncbi:MAG: ferrous iron transport protein B [Bacteroidaceae bacterium]|nr:ferrous iron transport protein B [Bacteroidaceae bacterium]MBP5522989.1 ferrous iron transport protein B [Bacteroidaceae bacterium]